MHLLEKKKQLWKSNDFVNPLQLPTTFQPTKTKGILLVSTSGKSNINPKIECCSQDYLSHIFYS